MSSPERLLATVLLAACAACGSLNADHAPRPRAVIPARGSTDQPLAVVIEGENFRPVARQRLGGEPPVVRDTRFQAFLGDVPLQEVRWRDAQHLEAIIPAGLPPGAHPLRVVSPLGQEGLLAGAFSVQRPAALSASLEANPVPVTEGGTLWLSLTVDNTGEVTAEAVTPAPPVSGDTPDPTCIGTFPPAPTGIHGGGRKNFTWRCTAGPEGTVTYSTSAGGTDASTGARLSTGVRFTSVEVLRSKVLSATLAAPERVNLGQEFELVVVVANHSNLPIAGVTPTTPTAQGVAYIEGPIPASATLAMGSSQAFTFRYTGAMLGTFTLSAGASGIDEMNNRSVSVPPDLEASTRLIVENPAELVSTLSAPTWVAPSSTFTVTHRVTNDGDATATEVTPSALVMSGSGDASLVSGPEPPSVTLGKGGSDEFRWTYVAPADGVVRFSGNATGKDANTGRYVSSETSHTRDILVAGVAELASDPFGDGTSFSFVFGYRGELYLGPSRDGRGGVRMALDGSGAQRFAFRLQADRDGTNGRASENPTPAPLPSIGATGCTLSTDACGPDNEDGRGLFFAGSVAGSEWLGVAGARSGTKWDYLYLTQDTDSELDFNFVDLSATLIGDKSASVSAAHFLADRLYLGVPDFGGSRPALLVLKTFPTLAPGLQVSSAAQAESLDAEAMPYVGKGGSPGNPAPAPHMVDALTSFRGLLYLANNGGCMRATVAQPRPYRVAPGDWASCTPPMNLSAWSGLTAITVTRAADLEPADRAVPQMAVFAGRLYLARNTTAGPQLFVCTPSTLPEGHACNPEEWSLVAPNSVGDTRLTQFNDPDNTRVTLLVATSRHLYIGFNNAARGVMLFRTANPLVSTRGHFSGSGGCSAALAPVACQGLGGNGLRAGVTRLFSGVALSSGAYEAVYLTAGGGSEPVRVFGIAD